MKTFEIRDGDLALGPGGHATVSGPTKLRQDLAVSMLEPFGCDRFHTQWGSLLSTMVGNVIGAPVASDVAGEIQRVTANYMAVQQDQMFASVTNSRKPTFTTGEVVSEIEGVDTQIVYDRLYARLRVSTLSGEAISVITTTTGA